MLKNAFKKYPPQNRTNVQIKGGGGKGLLNNVQKKCTFLKDAHHFGNSILMIFSFGPSLAHPEPEFEVWEMMERQVIFTIIPNFKQFNSRSWELELERNQKRKIILIQFPRWWAHRIKSSCTVLHSRRLLPTWTIAKKSDQKITHNDNRPGPGRN